MRIAYPAELPISAWRGTIMAAVRKHQVTVVSGDTGSGKTTQLPKMLLELGYGQRGLIACTQPRRLAAVEMSRRVAAELGEDVGGTVGFQHRFSRRLSDKTLVKFMTDGVLLSELRRDRFLRAYDAIVIDEAHERSLNIDILLGFLKRILERRRDLKVIISSATLDVELFSDFFNSAPIIEVPGKRYPVEIRHLPPEDAGDADLSDEILRAIETLPPEGDILAFLPGERDIREAAETLTARNAITADDEILPLMASLPAGEQQRVFKPSPRRKIILATNVAETSITIPGIRFVIDSGLARVPRFIHRSGIQRLQIEAVSQASANQRAGRCGRTGPGICIRLYSEEDYSRRQQFATPEILRTSLAGAVLQLLDLGVRDVASFPFPTSPEPSMLRVAMDELRELGAIDEDRRGVFLTSTGHSLTRMPVEPRIGRMILAAAKERAAEQVLPVAAFLSCEDPRRHSIEQREEAKQAYAKFKAPASDFASILKLWLWWREQTDGLSQNKRRKLCKANFLSYNRMSEWQEVWRQLTDIATQLGIDAKESRGGDAGLHRALLSGLLSRIGKFHDGDNIYRGARGASFAISPGSVLRRATPPWIMAAEIVDTQRPFASTVATIEQDWIEGIAGTLCRHAYRAPEWDAESGFVRAVEDVTLFGIPIVLGRRCDYSRIDPVASRDIFIRRGLIDGEYPTPPKEVAENSAAISRIRSAAAKLHRPELFDEDALAEHLDAAMPRQVCSAPALKRWLAAATPIELKRFRIDEAKWLPSDLPDDADFPDSIVIEGVRFPLEYRDEGGDEDGLTCIARRQRAHLLRSWRSDWLVPGLLRDKLAWMVSCLPAAQRRILAPTADTVSRLMTYLRPGERPLAEAVSAALAENWGLPVRPSAWGNVKVPAAYSTRFVIVDGPQRRIVAEGRDLEEVLADAGIPPPRQEAAAGVSARNAATKRHATWDFGDLDAEVVSVASGWKVCRHTALKDCGDGVEVVLMDTADEAERVHADGVARLLALSLGSRAASQIRLPKFPFQTALFLKNLGYDEKEIAGDVLLSGVKEAAVIGRPPVLTAAEFDRRRDMLRTALAEKVAAISPLIVETLNRTAAVSLLLETDSKLPESAVQGVKGQLAWLVFPSFARRIPLSRLRHYPRYLDATTMRLERAKFGQSADASRQREVDAYWGRYRDLIADAEEMRFADRAALVEYRWMVEEMRVSLFAQELKTPVPVSAKRLDDQWRKVIRK